MTTPYVLDRARPRLLIGVAFVALLGQPAFAQDGPADVDSVGAVVSTDSLRTAEQADPVFLVKPPRVALHARELQELRPSAGTAGTAGTAGATGIAAMERSRSVSDTATSHKGQHILAGIVIGTVAGGGLGYLAGKAWCDAHGEHGEGPPCEIGLPPLVALSAFVGLIAGGIIGAHVERKLPASTPLRRVAIDAVPLGARGMALAVTLQ